MDVQVTKSWTDDLPVCPQTGMGLSTNQIYKQDGNRREAHEFEDRSFHFKIDDSTFLYGVFNGNDGSSVADFSAQRMPAEILLGQLNEKTTPAEVKEVLREAYFAVERSYFESIDDLLVERANLLYELPEGISSYDAYKKYPDIVNRLRTVNARLSASTSAAVALIFRGNLYVANTGDCRSLLCKIDADGVLRVKQLSVDHDLTNEDELLRLSHIGLDIDKLRQSNSHLMTRCLGNYLVKGGYKDFDLYSAAKVEPVIAEAEITGPIPLDDSCRFLMLMTHGLYGALEEATGSEQINREIAQIVVEQFATQSTLTGVAQGVVDRVVRIHHDTYMQDPNHMRCCQRDDITLLLRNFNYVLSSPSCTSSSSTLRSFSSTIASNQNATEATNTASYCISGPIGGRVADSPTETLTETSITSSESSELPPTKAHKIVLDADGRIAPYVDFSSFYQAVQKAKEQGIIPADAKY